VPCCAAKGFTHRIFQAGGVKVSGPN
jgi:hypothetical protein